MKTKLINRLKVYLKDTHNEKDFIDLLKFSTEELKEIFTDHWEENIYFIHNNVEIKNPFLDETGRFGVDPFKYYEI